MKVRRPTLPHISGKNSLGRFMVRRTTIRKRMRAKLRQIKPELRKRMHDPVVQTGQWLRSVVQGHFHYYAVPGNNASLSLFRHRVLVCWWHSIRRRSQKHRINWTRMLDLGEALASPTGCAPSFPRCSLCRYSSEIRTGCANERPSGSVRGLCQEDAKASCCTKDEGRSFGAAL